MRLTSATRTARVLIVARRTADGPDLLAAVGERAAAGPCAFTLLVPASQRLLRPVADVGRLAAVADPDDLGYAAAERRLAAALPRLSEAAGSEVVGLVGRSDPLIAVRDALKVLGFDEVIVSMLPARTSRWLRLDLPGQIRALGVTVTEVIAAEHNPSPLSAA